MAWKDYPCAQRPECTRYRLGRCERIHAHLFAVPGREAHSLLATTTANQTIAERALNGRQNGP